MTLEQLTAAIERLQSPPGIEWQLASVFNPSPTTRHIDCKI
jgi:hypothetical protein